MILFKIAFKESIAIIGTFGTSLIDNKSAKALA